jgi:hypothetical protein
MIDTQPGNRDEVETIIDILTSAMEARKDFEEL